MEGIAVIGMAGRFPGADDCAAFWQNLLEGRESLRVFSTEEILASGVRLEEIAQTRVRARGVVSGAEEFDAGFFGYTPKEAEILDPQQRIFLEVAWEALESAGIDPDRAPGAIGVFAGSGINSYYAWNILTRPDVLDRFGIFPAILLNEKDFLATRLAYKLNLRGPAVTIQTACSTSLVAVVQACQSLMNYDCDVALAGGVSLVFPQCHSRIHEEGGMISADGHCRPFSADANGTLFSDGVGVVVLRRLEDAVEARDNILAVIKGYATNNDGADKAGFTAPSVNGQARVIRMAQSLAGVNPETITYVETHGTATLLGDPIEIAALTKAFRAKTNAKQFCAIGSVKSNIGHLDVAAGVAGLIKTVLALVHQQIPATINFTAQNPHIDFASSPFFVADRLLEWNPPAGVPRRAGVSSFGVGGTNAHVVLEEAPPLPEATPDPKPQLIVLSARSAAAVDQQSARLREHLAANGQLALADVAFTLQTGRRQFPVRRAVVCRNTAELVERLDAPNLALYPALTAPKREPPVVFMFPGQGAQRVNMGRECYEFSTLYRETVDSCARLLESELGFDLRTVLFPPPGKEKEAEQMLAQTSITQPALFVTEYAMAKLWMSWGIRPAAMIGHSVGEYTAACLANVFPLETALRLIASRGRLIQEQPPGTMLIVMEAATKITGLLPEEVSIAAINGPQLCVISGPEPSIRACEELLTARGLTTRRLHTSHAFHSAMMQGAIEPFRRVLETIELGEPAIPYMSNLSGKWITAAETRSPDYWTSHLRQAVNFSAGMTRLLENPEFVFLEVGPGTTLSSLGQMHVPRHSARTFVSSALVRSEAGAGDWMGLLTALGRLWQVGVNPDWTAMHAQSRRNRVALPTYPFERDRYYIEPGTMAQVPVVTAAQREEPVEAVPSSPAPTQDRDVGQALRDIVISLSGVKISSADGSRTFLELGFDSLFLAQLSRSIERDFGVAVTYRQLTDHINSLDRLADHVAANAAPATSSGSTAAKALPATSAGRPLAAPVAGLEALLDRLDALERKIDQLAASRGETADLKLPMTESQREIWLACQLSDDASRTYNESFVISLQGGLDVERLRRVLQQVVDSHDALRMSFEADGSAQKIRSELVVDLLVESVPDGDVDVHDWLQCRCQEIRDELFDLVEGPLIRFRLYRLGNDRHALQVVAHHLVVDGWSWQVLMREIGQRYAGGDAEIGTGMQYREYSRLLEARTHRLKVAEDEKYWLNRLADKPPEIDLPFDHRRGARKNFLCGHVRRSLTPDEVGQLRALAKLLDCTPFQIILASYAAWLFRVTGRTSLVIGVPMAGQSSEALASLPGIRSLVGHCVNLLPVRIDVDPKDTFADLVRHVRAQMADAREHQNISLGTLLGKLRWRMDPSRLPLVSVSLNMVRQPAADFGASLRAEVFSPHKRYSYFDMTVDVMEVGQELTLDCKFDASLIDAATMDRWLAQWCCLVGGAARNPASVVSRLDLLSAAERRQLLECCSGPAVKLPDVQTVHGLFAACAQRHPDRIALVHGEETLAYRQLEERVQRLARRLQRNGARRGDLVAVCLERSPRLVESLLAVLQAGCAYVPIDPAYPADRIRHVVEDSGAALVLVQQATRAVVTCVSGRVVTIDEPDDDVVSEVQAVETDAADTAYVIYTSGSTGKPKGVQVAHGAVINFLESMRKEPGLSAGDRLLAVTTISFDIAGLEIFLPLTTGATVVIAPENAVADAAALVQLIDAHDITVMQATPATWRLLLEYGWQGKPDLRVLCGGEPLPEDLARSLLPRVHSLWNMYGPTETTIWSTCCRVETADDIHIGRPIDNTTMRVVDESGELVPIGVAGELLIGGAGVAKGYLNRAELTAERFIQLRDEEGLYYRTGDLVKIRADGNLQCLGRLDFQVKIRGFRVEVGEVEATLAADPEVDQAVVVARPDTVGTTALVAYVRPKSASFDIEGVRDRLRRFLPDYMIPQYLVRVAEYPLTPNGKVDRKALEARPIDVAAREVKAPATPSEHAIARLFREILGAERVGVDDNFFHLGGHSIAAARLLARIRSELSAEIPLRTLFEDPTVGALARRVDEQGTSREPSTSSTQQQVRTQPVLSVFAHLTGLIPLRQDLAMLTLYGVPGHNGDVFCYRALAGELGPGRAVFGLQPPGLDGRSQPLSRVEDVARYFSSQILASRPQTPIVIMGYCAGGAVAFDLVRQLRQAGQAVALLVLLGTPYPSAYRRWRFALIRARDGWSRLRGNWARMLKMLNPFHTLELLRLLGRESVAGEVTAAELPDEQTAMMLRLQRSTIDAAARYEPVPIDVPIFQILPNRRWCQLGVANGRWRRLTPEYSEFLGPDDLAQETMLRPPHVRLVAGVLEGRFITIDAMTAGK
jgi:amino acid adenylation domain-containing protein